MDCPQGPVQVLWRERGRNERPEQHWLRPRDWVCTTSNLDAALDFASPALGLQHTTLGQKAPTGKVSVGNKKWFFLCRYLGGKHVTEELWMFS